MKILITGAHFTPALAVIEELKKRKNIEVIYVGRKNTMEGFKGQSLESQILPKMGVKYLTLTTGRLQRSFSIYTIPSLLKIPIGIIQSFYITFSQKPDVVLSFGGYVAVPLVIMAWLFSIPIIVHEQTLVSGLANKISSFFANKIAISFARNLKEKEILTGNPIRKMILESKLFSGKEKLPRILIMGGNQGSHVINLAVEGVLDKLTRVAVVTHISGDNKFKDFERLEKLQSENYKVKKIINEDYGTVLSKADFVVSRAGVNTLTELAFLGKPALVIPISYLYLDEQNKNARYFEKLRLVKILPQSKLSGNILLQNIKEMLKNLSQLKQKAKNAKAVIIADAAKRLALETILLK